MAKLYTSPDSKLSAEMIYDTTKAKTQNTINAQLDDMVIVSDSQPSSANNRLWVSGDNSGLVKVPTYNELLEVGNEVVALRAAVGSPLQASTSSGMTNRDKIYVYTGSQSGYTFGHWYYWNGTAWTDGGTYNETALETDTTLTVSGKAADAKKTGDEIDDLKNTLIASVTSIYDKWEMGGFISETGLDYNVDTRIRMQAEFSLASGVEKIECDNGYTALLFAWDSSGTYLGSYHTDGTFQKNSKNLNWVSEFDLNLFSSYTFKIAVKDSTSSSNITTNAKTNIHFQYCDGTFTKKYKSADAKEVGDAFDVIKNTFDDFSGNTFDITPGKNLYNPANTDYGQYLYAANGITEADASYNTTEFIPVTAGMYATFSRKTTGIYAAYAVPSYAFYSDDNEASYISGSTYKVAPVVPDNAQYIRVCINANIEDMQIELTEEGVFTSYEPYHTPIYTLKENIPLPVDQIDGNVADKIENITVKGTNLIPISENGVGAYFLSYGNIVFEESYTTYHYAIINVKKNTRYYVNYPPRWWILADENNDPISGAQYFTPYGKHYIDTGNATKFYYTVELGSWNTGVIISEGLRGQVENIQQSSVLKPINQLMCDGWYACALPKDYLYFTVGFSQKFYYKNILSLPDNNVITLGIGGFSTNENDGVTISPVTAGDFSNYLYTIYDNNLSVIEKNVNGQFGRKLADNLSNCSALIIGDSTVERDSGKIGQTIIDAFSDRGKTVTLLGTRGNGANKNEGRSGWSAGDYVRTESRDGVDNAFYNPETETFDFSYYMTQQGYSSVDFVIVQLGINDLYNVDLPEAKGRIDTLVNDMFTILTSIKAYNQDQKIILNLPTPCTAKTSGTYALTPTYQKIIRAKFIYYNSLMEVLHTNFSKTRCSHCHLILDPEEDIVDLIHPTTAGLEKMGMEVVSQINCFQNT